MKVSVCIPVFNVAPHLLKATIDSVIGQQNGFEMEIIISDDASHVDYRPLSDGFPPTVVTFHRNSENLGMVRNWNVAVQRSSGEIVMLLGHDDILEPEIFRNYLGDFQKNPEVVLCSCGRKFIDEQNQELPIKRHVNDRSNIFVTKEKYVLHYRKILALCLRNGNVIGEPSAVMYRRWALEKVKGYDEGFEHAADLDLHLRIAQLGSLVYFTNPFLRRRIHRGNLTRKNIVSGKVFRDRIRLFERFRGTAPFTDQEIRSFRAYLFASSILDLSRATLAWNTSLAWEVLKSIPEYIDFSPSVYVNYIREIMTRENADAL